MRLRQTAMSAPLLVAGSLFLTGPVAVQAQASQPDTVTAADYARAERFLATNVRDLLYGTTVRPEWLEDGRFWYRNDVRGGQEFVLVDPEAPSRERAFDHERLAAALSAVSDTTYEPLALPNLEELDPDAALATFADRDREFTCDLDVYTCEARTVSDTEGGNRPPEVTSPDGRRAAFIRDHDLWVRDLETGAETRLTTDGVEDHGYATNNAGWTRSDAPVVKWSPDSRRIATFRHDARGVGMMYLVTTEVGHPELEAWRYPLPEDTVIFRIERVVVDVEAQEGERVVRLDLPPDPHRSTVCDHIRCGGTFADVEWADDGSSFAFVSSSRDHKHATVRIADAATGEVRDVLEETVPTFFESGGNWRYLADSDEVLWYSRRDDHGHLYLYDAATGEVKRQVTSGSWNVHRVLEVDPDARTVTFIGNGREPGDPYFQYLYRVGLDGGDVRLLTPDSANHSVAFSPSGTYFIDSWSTPDTPPVTVLRTADGEQVLELERADITDLLATGWIPPEPFTVKARDGETDLYGLLFRPTDLDPEQSYPVVNYVYPGPQSGSVGGRSFDPARRDHQALAELGFIVVALDAMGTPMRSQSFHEAYYGDMGDNGLPDQIAGIRQLAERHPWMDLDRVGIWGHSGGGFASARAIMAYPDFYRVAVSQAGNHDNRLYEDDWGEKWQGLLVEYEDGTTSYDNQANHLLADSLRGKLLLAHGTMDSNVPPYNTLVVVDALIEANKDFDLILLPNRGHGFANEPYMMRRRWDYFVQHLLGAEPPREYEFGSETSGGG